MSSRFSKMSLALMSFALKSPKAPLVLPSAITLSDFLITSTTCAYHAGPRMRRCKSPSDVDKTRASEQLIEYRTRAREGARTLVSNLPRALASIIPAACEQGSARTAGPAGMLFACTEHVPVC